MKNIKSFLTFVFFSASISLTSIAKTFDRPFIENFAQSYLETQFQSSEQRKVDITVSKIDPRITIKACQSPLTANIPENHNSRNLNVKISCEDSIPWSIYLPAKIKTLIPVLVAIMPIDKGSLLTDENTQVRYISENLIHGESFSTSENVVGAKTKRNIRKGAAVSPKNICLVCKGDNITLIARTSALTIKTSGTSLSNGHIGDKVRVKNSRSGKTVFGRVDALNKVVIIL